MSIRSFWDGSKGCLRDGPPERGRWVMRNGELVPLGTTATAEGIAPAVVDDTILGGIESPLTGEMYYSRTKLFQHYKANGYVCTGGDHFTGNKHLMNPPKADGARIRDQALEVFEKMKNAEVPILDHGDPIPENNLYMTRREVEECREQERKMEPRRYRR